MRQRGPIKDFALGIYDGPHATPAESHEGPVYLGIPNVTTDGRLDLTDIRHISEHEYPKWVRRAIPQKDDLVFSYEATLHRYALIPDDLRCCLGRRMCLVRPNTNKVYPRFLLYYFLSSKWRAVIESNIVVGATVERIPIAKFPDFEVELPPLDVQRRIADILSAYDDLIENNRRRIDLLEQSARMLYKEWFVSLRFPGHEHVKVKDGVPQGWERVSLSKVAEVNRESLRSNFQGDIEYIDIASVSTGTIEETTLYSFEDAPGRARRVVKHGDIIWSCVRPNRKSYSVIWNPAENLIASTGFAVLSPTDVPTSFLLQATTTDDFVGYLSNNARGAAYPAVTGADFEKAIILVPVKTLLQQYNDFTEPLLSQIYTLQQHNRKLKQARDLLLPRLMNGEIPV